MKKHCICIVRENKLYNTTINSKYSQRLHLTNFSDHITIWRPEYITTPSSPDYFHGTRITGEQQYPRRHVSLIFDYLHSFHKTSIPDTF